MSSPLSPLLVAVAFEYPDFIIPSVSSHTEKPQKTAIQQNFLGSPQVHKPELVISLPQKKVSIY